MSKCSTKVKVKKVKAEALGCVPYQVCPICNGVGRNIVDAFKPDAHFGNGDCPVCKGKMIIPMHIATVSYERKPFEFSCGANNIDAIFKSGPLD